LPRNLHWSDALELIRHIGQVEARGHDEFAFVVGTRRELFKRSRAPQFAVEEVSRFGTFLRNAGSDSARETPLALAAAGSSAGTQTARR
jgi:hypothetical protein